MFDGNIGIIETIDPVEQELSTRFDDRLLQYEFGELDEVAAMQHYMLLQRNPVYTGIITRPSSWLVVVGQRKLWASR